MLKKRSGTMLELLAVVVSALVCSSSAFYLPGVAPVDFALGEQAIIKANSLTSPKTALPMEYYDLPVCRPQSVSSRAENLGEVLRGDRIHTSPYTVEMRHSKHCQVVCRIPSLSASNASLLNGMIQNNYRLNMILDNLPAALVVPPEQSDTGETQYERGFPLGRSSSSTLSSRTSESRKRKKRSRRPPSALHNHIRFKVLYHRDERTDLSRIVGFEAEPMSIKHAYDGEWRGSRTKLTTCPPISSNPASSDLESSSSSSSSSVGVQPVQPREEIVYTYDVVFKESNIKWASRWDMYLKMSDHQIHWFSIVNSLLILIFLTGMVATIMVRTLRQDISQYNALDSVEEAQEESGWKLLHGDVFRNPPAQPMLAVSVGTGMQLFAMAFLTMVFAMLGFLSPANRGGLMTAMIILFALMGSVAGHTTGQMLREAGASDWKSGALKASLYFPLLVFAIFFVLNLLVWYTGSSGAVPFGTLCALCALWFGVSVPLALTGGYWGFKRSAVDIPVRTNKIPRQVPSQPWYLHPVFTSIIGGMLPFGAVFIELSFILTSLWLHEVYYVFGFLFIVFVIMSLTCAEISIVLCYFQLCSEDYNWWWRSFTTSAASSVYVLAYCTYYYFTRLELINPVSTSLYFGYTLIFCVAFALMTGSIGFSACHWFVKRIYSSVKVD